MRFLISLCLLVLCWQTAEAQQTSAPQESDAYTRYELLDPGSGKFHIVYDVTASRPGAVAYFNPIRKGSVAFDEKVIDQSSGAALAFSVVPGAAAKGEGLSDADADGEYIRIQLAHPVPEVGGARLRIEKTYKDDKSYYRDGDELVFSRSLGIKRNAVVLPPHYVLTACNFPSQIEQEADGRLKISFLNISPAAAPLVMRARKADKLPTMASSLAPEFVERARQTRDIVYFLQQPETHAFDLYHDYTEERTGVGHYVNVVRTGSAASNPSALNLDSGEKLVAETLKGAAITEAGIHDPDLPAITPDTEVVLFRFRPLEPHQSIRLRMSETYTDPKSYRLEGDELIFRRTFGRPANAVVLPSGWILTNSAVPAIVSETADHRVRLDFLNPRTDEVAVLITARRGS